MSRMSAAQKELNLADLWMQNAKIERKTTSDCYQKVGWKSNDCSTYSRNYKIQLKHITQLTSNIGIEKTSLFPNKSYSVEKHALDKCV